MGCEVYVCLVYVEKLQLLSNGSWKIPKKVENCPIIDSAVLNQLVKRTLDDKVFKGAKLLLQMLGLNSDRSDENFKKGSMQIGFWFKIPRKFELLYNFRRK